MKEIINTILKVIVIVLFISILLNPCGGVDNNIIIRDTTYVYDTTWVEVIVDNTKYPKPIVIYEDKWRDRPVDTAEIIKDYVSKKAYTRTLVNDSNLTLVSNDTLQFNDFLYTDVKYRINRPTQIINNNYYYEDKWTFSAGAFIDLTPSDSIPAIDIGPAISFKYKKSIYSIEYGLMQESVRLKFEREIFKSRKEKGLLF